MYSRHVNHYIIHNRNFVFRICLMSYLFMSLLGCLDSREERSVRSRLHENRIASTGKTLTV